MRTASTNWLHFLGTGGVGPGPGSILLVPAEISAGVEAIADAAVASPTSIIAGEVTIGIELLAELEGAGRPEPPCPGFPARAIDMAPIIQARPEAGPLIAERSVSIQRHEVQVELANLSPAARDQLLELWDSGVSMVRPFRWQAPGDSEERLYVFRDPSLVIEGRSPSQASGSLLLLAVDGSG